MSIAKRDSTGLMLPAELTKEGERYSGFRRPQQEEFYDLLTIKLIELLVERIMTTPIT